MLCIKAVLLVGLASQTYAFVGITHKLASIGSLLKSLPLGRRSTSVAGNIQCTAGSSKPKLLYFDGRGVVEPARLMFAAAGVEFEDVRYRGMLC
jgi:hypothetical protein